MDSFRRLTNATGADDLHDAAHWDAVEEVTELLHEERFHEALTTIREILTRDASNPYAFYFMGIALFEVGEIAPARDAYRACLRLAPTHLGARVALSHVLRMLGELKEAVQEAQNALDQAPGDGDALYAGGLAFYARGENVAAKRYLEAFLEQGPEFEVASEVKAMLAGMDQRN